MQTFDHETSVEVARRVRAQYRRCWRNAALAVSHLGPQAFYVEGWVITHETPPFVIEHGWCEVDGRIVDPTYPTYPSAGETPNTYFAGSRYEVSEAEAAIERGVLPFAWSHVEDAYWKAFDSAWREATKRQPEAVAAPTRVVHCRREPFDVFIGRPSRWASPFHIGPDGTREEVVIRFRRWLVRQPGLLRAVWSLRGKVLGCRCAPLPCHGDVLAELANCDLIVTHHS